MTTALAAEPTLVKNKRTLSAEGREVHVKAWQASGLTMSAYCREHQLSLSSLSVWVSKSKSKKSVSAKRFFPVKGMPKANIPTSQLMVKVTLTNGIGVQLQAPLSLDDVIQLARELSQCN